MPTTRLNASQPIADQLESGEDICIITKEALQLIIRENADERKDQTDLSRRIAVSLERIADCMDGMKDNATTTSATLCQKLDDLTATIKNSNTSFMTSSTDVDEYLSKRKSLAVKIARHEALSEYYSEQIQVPFIRKEFRVKVNKNASETDLRHRRKQAIDNVNYEIAIMQDRLIEFGEQKNKLDEKIEKFLQQNEDSRAEISEQVKNIDLKAREDYTRDKLSLIKKTDEEEKRTITEFLLSFQGEERDSSGQRDSKNSRGGRKSRPPRRGQKH